MDADWEEPLFTAVLVVWGVLIVVAVTVCLNWLNQGRPDGLAQLAAHLAFSYLLVVALAVGVHLAEARSQH